MEVIILNEMRMAKFETLIMDVNESINKNKKITFITKMWALSFESKKLSPLYMIFEPEKINEFALVICDKAKFELVESVDQYRDDWGYKYSFDSLSDAKTKIEAAKDFVKYCRGEQGRAEAYKFIFWALMILSVEKESSAEWLSLICDFTRMLRITDEELMDITYAIKCVYNEVKDEYVFKTETIPGVLGNLFNLYGNSDFVVE